MPREPIFDVDIGPRLRADAAAHFINCRTVEIVERKKERKKILTDQVDYY